MTYGNLCIIQKCDRISLEHDSVCDFHRDNPSHLSPPPTPTHDADELRKAILTTIRTYETLGDIAVDALVDVFIARDQSIKEQAERKARKQWLANFEEGLANFPKREYPDMYRMILYVAESATLHSNNNQESEVR